MVLGTTPRIIDDREIGPKRTAERSASAGGRIAVINRRAKNSLRRTTPKNADRERAIAREIIIRQNGIAIKRSYNNFPRIYEER